MVAACRRLSGKGPSKVWGSCIKSHHTWMDLGHGLQMSYSSCQAAAEQQTTSSGLKKKEQVCLFSDERISDLIWSKSLEEEWRGTQSMMLEVQCELSTRTF